jgi:hypothetical protein
MADWTAFDRFKEWASRNGYPIAHDYGQFIDQDTQRAWNIWKAADEAKPAAGVATCDARQIDRVEHLLELARQYAHAYYNYHTGSRDGMLDKTHQALREALTADVSGVAPSQAPSLSDEAIEAAWTAWYDAQPIKPFPHHIGHKCFVAGAKAARGVLVPDGGRTE